MLHLGDITKISGYTAPIVDCVVGGSPCQDLSIAGKRAGLDGERSGLFMEQVRIVKEMRDRDERDNGRTGVDVRPRYLVWENVPGAFSSNKGEDFRIVLEEIARVKDETAVIPRPDKWQTSGCIVGDGWSIAWRVLDAQFWGVPQRRRRIALVADFGGESAPEILFVRKGVSGHSQPSESERKAVAHDAERSIGADDIFCIDGDKLNKKERSGGSGVGYREGNQYTLTAKDVHGVAYTMKIRSGCDVDASKAAGKGALIQTDMSRMGTGGGNVPMVMQNECVINIDRETFNCGQKFNRNLGISDDGVVPTLKAVGPGAVCYSVDQGGGKSACNVTEGQAPTLTCTHGVEPAICYSLDPASSNPHSGCHDTNVARTIDTTNPDPSKNQGGVAVVETYQSVTGPLMANSHPGSYTGQDAFNDMIVASRTRYTVRRLTPLECERLQGYPDGWTDIGEYTDTNGRKKQSSDAARYKALGNSIALPPWKLVMKRLCACYERDATLASLFDGIGGFPYIWEQINGKGSCLWASEIEEFPIGVTKVRIGE